MVSDMLIAASSAVSALLLICMLQVEFRRSSKAFRWAVKSLSASLMVSTLLPWMRGPYAEVVEVAVHLALLAVLGLVRWRQLRTGRCGAR